MQSGMDKYCIHALESLLRGSDWESKFRTFYFSVCPRFKSYIESSISNDGSGYDLLMFDAYKDFLAFFDLNIQHYLDEMGVTLSTLGESLFSHLVENDSSAMNLRDQLEMYGDFDKFSMIMRTKFQETFTGQKLKLDVNTGIICGTLDENSPPITECETTVLQVKPDKTTGPAPARSRAVRVLWDIENIMVSRDIGGLNTLTRLNE
jgi:The ARF-like 2 binding protein BART